MKRIQKIKIRSRLPSNLRQIKLTIFLMISLTQRALKLLFKIRNQLQLKIILLPKLRLLKQHRIRLLQILSVILPRRKPLTQVILNQRARYVKTRNQGLKHSFSDVPGRIVLMNEQYGVRADFFIGAVETEVLSDVAVES